MMILLNEIYKQDGRPKSILRGFTQILAPFAPHFCEELWSRLGGKGYISLEPWPQFDPELAKDEAFTMGVQINGKMKGTIDISLDTSGRRRH